ncbi:MAG: hypothetical protein OHK0041_01050 [Anaerolineales bacterium]
MIRMKKFFPALALFIVAVLAYGLLTPRLGFYWDDLPITWIRYTLGAEALTRYFSTNRPVWGLLHQVTTRLIPQAPAYWQVFALVWRWLGAAAVYLIVAKLWRDKGRLALGVSLLFLVYPGFNQHWAAYLYSHFYIVLFFFLASFLCMLVALEQPRRYWAWTAAGLVFSALNLWMMEYFYVLELVRVGFILTAIRGEELTLLQRLKRTLSLWTPYLAVFTLAVLSRLFVFNNQVYGISLTAQLKSAPLETLIALARNIKKTLELVLRDAWLKIFELPDVANAEAILRSYYLVVAVLVIVVIAGFLLLPREAVKSLRRNIADSLWMIGLGGLSLLLSGWPFWLIGFPTSLNWPASRFTLPFMLGAALVFAGLISLLPWEKVRIVLMVALVSMAAGKQYLTSHEYLQDWQMQKDLFWQMTWRAPSIAPGTLILMNEGALKYYADNSLSAALNWVYAPQNHSDRIPYVLFYPTNRFKTALPDIAPDLPVFYDYLAGEFHGNTSQTLSFYFAPPGCLRLLDPEVERLNRLIPENSLMRYAARLTDPRLILEEPRAVMPAVYGPEPEHGFCYYYQKADLARQFGRWEEALQFVETALAFEDHPYEPAEHLLFIEVYAHAGQWERALELSKRAYEVSPQTMGRVICQLWERISAETGESLERDALEQVRSMFACSL